MHGLYCHSQLVDQCHTNSPQTITTDIITWNDFFLNLHIKMAAWTEPRSLVASGMNDESGRTKIWTHDLSVSTPELVKIPSYVNTSSSNLLWQRKNRLVTFNTRGTKIVFRFEHTTLLRGDSVFGPSDGHGESCKRKHAASCKRKRLRQSSLVRWWYLDW